MYGLDILDTDIQDNKNNLTRFIILSRDPRVQVTFLQGFYRVSTGFAIRMYTSCQAGPAAF